MRVAQTLAAPLTICATLANLLLSLGLYFLTHKSGPLWYPPLELSEWVCVTWPYCIIIMFLGKASWRSWGLTSKAPVPNAQRSAAGSRQGPQLRRRSSCHPTSYHAGRSQASPSCTQPNKDAAFSRNDFPHPTFSFIHTSFPWPNHLQGKFFLIFSLYHFYSNKMPGFSYSLQRNLRKT